MASQEPSLAAQKASRAYEILEMRRMVVTFLRENRRALNSLTLASHLWKVDVQNVIFRDITIFLVQRRSAHDFIFTCVDSVHRFENTPFCANIHTLTLRGSPWPLTREYSDHNMHQPDLSVNEICTIVSVCPNIDELRIGNFAVDGRHMDAFMPHWEVCQHRSINVHVYQCHFTSSALYTLLKFTRVRELFTFRLIVMDPMEDMQPDMLAYAHKLTLSRVLHAQRPKAHAHFFSQEDWVTKMYKAASPATLTALTVQCSLKGRGEMWRLYSWLPVMGANLQELGIDCSETEVRTLRGDMSREQWIEEDTVFSACHDRIRLVNACPSLRSLTLTLSIDQERTSPEDAVEALPGERRVVNNTDTFVMWIWASRLLEAAPPTLTSITIVLCSHGGFNLRHVLPMDTTLRVVPWARWRNALDGLPLLRQRAFVVQDLGFCQPGYPIPKREFDWDWTDHLYAFLEEKGIFPPRTISE